jgi:hypothetical protein
MFIRRGRGGVPVRNLIAFLVTLPLPPSRRTFTEIVMRKSRRANRTATRLVASSSRSGEGCAPPDRDQCVEPGLRRSVERLCGPLHDKVLALLNSARWALATNPADAEATIRLKVARQTLFIAFVAAGRATLGWVQIDDEWKAKRESPPHGAVAWPDSLDRFYTRGPFAGASRLFGYAISDQTGLVQHVRRVIEAGIREDARLNQGRNRQVGGPADVVLIDATGARCFPSCPPP